MTITEALVILTQQESMTSFDQDDLRLEYAALNRIRDAYVEIKQRKNDEPLDPSLPARDQASSHGVGVVR
jgi:hypothetical protein